MHHPIKFMVLTLSVTYLVDKVVTKLFDYWDEQRKKQANSRKLEEMLRLIQFFEIRQQLNQSSMSSTSSHASDGAASREWHLEASTPNGTVSGSTTPEQSQQEHERMKVQFEKDYEAVCDRLQKYSIKEEDEEKSD